MKTYHTISLIVGIALLGMPTAHAGPMKSVLDQSPLTPAITVDADCFSVGQDKADELGGELAKASPDTVEGAPVCHVVIVVPGKDGARPKRVAIDIPQ